MGGGEGEELVIQQDTSLVGGAENRVVSRAALERQGRSENPQGRAWDPISEEDDGAGPIVLAGDPDQTVNAIVTGMESPRPGGRTRVLPLGGLDQVQSGNVQPPEPETENLGQSQVTVADQCRDSQRS